MEVMQDEQLSSNAGQVCSGIKLRILLDSSGDVSTTPPQSVWSPENMIIVPGLWMGMVPLGSVLMPA
jgi:hypothetical protein